MDIKQTHTGIVAFLSLSTVLICSSLAGADSCSLEAEAGEAMEKATRFFVEEVATEGGYLWEYTADLEQRWGEGKASKTEVWVQPPGTPSVGSALLRAYLRTGNKMYLQAARRAAEALVWGQLATGGWDYRINFDPRVDKTRWTRRDVQSGDDEPQGRFYTTNFDDDTTQSALRFLMCFDEVTGFKHEPIHEAVQFGLKTALAAQYPSGGWPQRYIGPYDPKDWPVVKAHYPETWSRTFPDPRPHYQSYYTLNDATIADLVDTMLLAYRVYGEERYLQSARKGGDFLILAQMPEPQPAWAQQYQADMTPAWARRFEPPSVVSSESVSAIETLMKLYVWTGDERYREPIAPAIAWFKRVGLPDGRHARFYELETNTPLYFNRKYELVTTDDDMPTHYAFKVKIDVAGLENKLAKLDQQRKAFLEKSNKAQKTCAAEARAASKPPESKVKAVIKALDERGSWIDQERIKCRSFIRNLDILSAYVRHCTDRQRK
jgi:hypothetical protein